MPSSLSSASSFCHHPRMTPAPPYNKEEVTCIRGYYREPIIGVPPSPRRTGNPKKGVIIISIGLHILEKV